MTREEADDLNTRCTAFETFLERMKDATSDADEATAFEQFLADAAAGGASRWTRRHVPPVLRAVH